MKRRRTGSLVVVAVAAVALAALGSCTAGRPSTSGQGGTIPTANNSSSSATASGNGAAASSSSTGFMATATSGTAPPCVPGGPNDDVDGDGWTPAQGDCNDCDPNVNPNAIDVAPAPGGMWIDSDCDGDMGDGPVTCDDNLAIDSADPMDAAKAIDICRVSTDNKHWGLVSANWVLADGMPPPTDPTLNANFHLGHGILTKWGANGKVRNGKSMLVLSSGSARQPTDPGYHNVSGFDKGFTSGQPAGFPKESPACLGITTGQPHDDAGIEFVIRTPSNAKGIAFDFDFFTYEWPGFVCSQYNDFFVALLTPIPPGQNDGNIVFDQMGNPISVNNAFLGACGCTGNPPTPCIAGGKMFACPLGDSQLIGTGFGFDTAGSDHGSTGWLTTQAPVKGNDQITLRFAVYDSSDGILDTTTLIDNFRWIATPGTAVKTMPIPQ